MKNAFEVMLEKLTGTTTQEVLEEAADRDGLFGVKVGKSILKFTDKATQGRVKKVVDAYCKSNPSCNDKTLFRLAGVAVKMTGATTKEIISTFECATGECYKDFLNISKAPTE